MQKNVHEKLILRYAQDWVLSETPWRFWQLEIENEKTWVTLEKHPDWDPGVKYRRKPLEINGREVPEPLRFPLKDGEVYSYVDFESDTFVSYRTWNDNHVNLERLHKGICHLDEASAAAHAKALLSFFITI